MNAFDAILEAVMSTLARSPRVTEQILDEDIDVAGMAEDVTECVTVQLGDSDPERAGILRAPIDWTSQIVVSCYARVDSRGAGGPGRASRQLQAKVYARLMEDITLGGLVHEVLPPALSSDSDQADTRIGSCVGIYPVRHRTAAGTLEI
jgi:hypothetical protein